MSVVIMVIILLTGVVDSLIVWDYPMCYRPNGWTSYNWGYNSIYGAYLIIGASSPWAVSDGEMESGEDTVFVPDVCDSIILHADQELYINTSGTGASYIVVEYSYGSDWDIIWTKGGNYSSMADLHISIPVTPGGTLFLKFFGLTAAGPNGSGSVAWSLSFLTLTLYGAGVHIARNSWASIKSAF